MNYSTAIFLINKNARGIMAVYESFKDDEQYKRNAQLFKSLDPSIQVGDFVVVETNTRHNMTVVKVTEIDVDFDLTSTAKVEWIVAKVDRVYVDNLKSQEADAIKAIKSAELRKKREDLREALFADHIETLKALPLADMEPSAIPAPTPEKTA